MPASIFQGRFQLNRMMLRTYTISVRTVLRGSSRCGRARTGRSRVSSASRDELVLATRSLAGDDVDGRVMTESEARRPASIEAAAQR